MLLIERFLEHFHQPTVNLKNQIYHILGTHNLIHINLGNKKYVTQVFKVNPVSLHQDEKHLASIISKYIDLLRDVDLVAKEMNIDNNWYLFIYGKSPKDVVNRSKDLQVFSNGCLLLQECTASEKSNLMDYLTFHSYKYIRVKNHVVYRSHDLYTVMNVKSPKQNLPAFWLSSLANDPNVNCIISLSTLQNHHVPPKLGELRVKSLDPNLTPVQQINLRQQYSQLLQTYSNMTSVNETMYSYSVQLIIHGSNRDQLQDRVESVKHRFYAFKFSKALSSKADLLSLITPLPHKSDNNLNHYLIQSYDLGGSYPFVSKSSHETIKTTNNSVKFNRRFIGGKTATRDIKVFGNVSLLDAIFGIAIIGGALCIA